MAARLIADTELFESRFDRDFFGDLGPRKPTGAYVLGASRLVITRVRELTERLRLPRLGGGLCDRHGSLYVLGDCHRYRKIVPRSMSSR